MTIVHTPFALTEAQIHHYNEHGYVIVRNLFSKEEIEPLRLACEADTNINNSQTEIKYDNGISLKLSVWSELGNSMLGVIPRMARIVNSAEVLEGEECYHWHSKIVLKKPGEGFVGWHQGFGNWYEDGCLYPRLASCCIAINDNTRMNGCLQIAKGSHHLGRIENVLLPNSNTNGTDPERLKVVLERLEVIYCELKQGDAVFFHANTLHGSDANQTNKNRIAMFSTYNIVSNEPYDLTNQMHHRYRPLEKLSDSVLLKHQYDGIFETQKFLGNETEDSSNSGISLRYGRTKKISKVDLDDSHKQETLPKR